MAPEYITVIVSVLCSGVAGVFTGIVTVTALRVDISWMKSTIDDHEERLKYLERSINANNGRRNNR